MQEDSRLTILVDLPNFVLRRGGEHVLYLKALLRELGGGSPRIDLQLFLSPNRWVTEEVNGWLEGLARIGVVVTMINDRPTRGLDGWRSEPMDEALRAAARRVLAQGRPIMIASHDAGFAPLIDEARRLNQRISFFGLAPGNYQRWHIGGDWEEYWHSLPRHFRRVGYDNYQLWAPSSRLRRLRSASRARFSHRRS